VAVGIDGGWLPDDWVPFAERPLVERLYEISNQLGGHVDMRTSERDKDFFLKLSDYAAKAAEDVVAIEERARGVVGWRTLDPETGGWHFFGADDEVLAEAEATRLGTALEPLALAASA
jgi:hypothetical protein